MNGSAAPAVPDVSFVVIAYNERVNIVRCLTSITSQVGGASYEVVVVDDGSGDGTASLVGELAARSAEISLIEHPRNRGRGAARQTGITAARGALIAMVDADIVLPEDWLENCRGALAIHDADAVGGIAVPDGDVSYVCSRFSLRPRPVRPTVPVGGGNGLYRREVFDSIGVDPSLSEGEDVALNREMEASGFRSRTLSEVIVEHREDKNFLQSLRWLYESGRGASRQFIRYREVRTPDLALVGQLAAIGLGAALRRQGIDRRIAWTFPCAYLIAASGGHLRRKFEIRGNAGRFSLATATYALLMGGYFAGRITGVPRALRDSSKTRPVG